MTTPAPALRIVHEAPSWVVVDKPPGLLSVPGKGDEPFKKDCVPARLAVMFPRATGPLVVHRLDMDTSGLMILGLTPDAQRELSRQFEERRVGKRYVALLDGASPGGGRDEGEIDIPIRPDIDHRPWQIMDGLHGRRAITRWRIAAREIDRTRIHFEPITGRAHQLRVHAAFPTAWGGLGCCIIGDVLYGSGYRGPVPDEARGVLSPAERLMLHAAMLEFTDPDTGRAVRFESEPGF